MAVNIAPFITDAQKIQNDTGIPASIILAQIMLESGGKYEGGLSGLAVRSNNLFGIKGTGTAGSVQMPTGEFKNGSYQTEMANFRKYNSYYESMRDHAKLLSNERYAKHLKNAKTVNDFANGIKAGGYATDPQYATKLMAIIQKNNLNQYDTGNLTFTPVSGDTATGDTSTKDDSFSMIENLYFHTIRAILIVMLFILMVIFFLKAFPAVEAITSNLPQAKVLKAVKGAK